jgi:hypothetical protein
MTLAATIAFYALFFDKYFKIVFGTETFVLGALTDALTNVLESFGVHWQRLLIQSLNYLSVIGILY